MMKSSTKLAEVGKNKQEPLNISYKIVKRWHKVVKTGKKQLQYISVLYELKLIRVVYELKGMGVVL